MARTHIVICERCGYSVVMAVPDFPASCAGACTERQVQEPPTFRLALAGEYTPSDQRFLRSLRIRSDALKT